MAEILCEVCKVSPKTRVSQGLYCCDTCQPKPLQWAGICDKVYLPHYGMVEASRLKGLDSRRILPESNSNGDYVVGSVRNGKITDKEPDY